MPEGNAPRNRPRPSSRAVIAVVVIAATAAALILMLGRPDTVRFTASFKCLRFAPASTLSLVFERCTTLKLRANTVAVPLDAFFNFEESKYKPFLLEEGDELKFFVLEGGQVTIHLQGNGSREATLELSRDGVLEIPSWKSQPGVGEFRLTASEASLAAVAWHIELETPSDGDFTGFKSKLSDDTLGNISLDGGANSQGGIPDSVYVGVHQVSGPVSIRGQVDDVAGWRPISTDKSNPSNEYPVQSGRLWAEGLSNCLITIEGQPVDGESSLERLQMDLSKAKIDSLSLYQDEAEKYISVQVSGSASSIKQNNKEAIEPVIAKLLSKPGYQNGIAGLALVFIVFAGGIVLKRALEVLAELWIPDSK